MNGYVLITKSLKKMKKHIYILLICTLSTNCSKHRETIIGPVNAELATFRATFMGQSLSLTESITDSIFSDSGFGYLLEDGKKPSFIYAFMDLISRPNKPHDRIHLYLPTIRIENFTFEGIQRLLSIGKKEFDVNPVFGNDKTFDFAFKRGFIFALASQNPALSPQGYRNIFHTVGNQDGSELKIIESKEIFPPSGYERAIQVRFFLNCKLYSGEQFIGEMQNAEFTLKFYYKKLDF